MSPHLEARAAGISTTPIDPRTKRSRVPWSAYQIDPPDLDIVNEWIQRGWNDLAAICGQVSERLIALDFESAFMPRLGELAERLRARGLQELFQSWIDGYCEETPHGGMHVLVRIGGDDPMPHNDKLARDTDGQVTIETRGEGGYCIIAPSRNGDAGWKLCSGGLNQIAWTTPEEWAAVAAVLSSFDEGTSTPPPPVHMTPSILRLGEPSWIDQALASLGPVAEILVANGWQQARSTDSYGQHWVRPDKDPREGHSASVNHDSGRLWVHSTNAGLPVGVSMDACDLTFALRTGRIPTLTERTEVLRALRPPNRTGEGSGVQAADPAPTDTSVRLDNSFWQSLSWLSAVRTAAWARGLAPSGVLGALLSAYATTVPMGIWIPPVWGERAPLNTYCCLVGQSGSGKTASMRLALDLLGVVHNPDILLGRSLRSGEGLINLVTKARAKGADPTQPPTYRTAVQVTFDEGAALGKQAERAGATVIPYLNTAWAGHGAVGGAKASEAGYFPADLVRVCALIGVQFRAAANLFTGESAALGFPQRLLFFGLRDEEMMNHDVDEMSTDPVRPLGLPTFEVSEFTRHPLYLEVPAEIVREVRLWTRSKEHGEGLADPLDGHAMQLRLRLAGVIGLMSGERTITTTSWDLASTLCRASRLIRSQLVAAISDVSTERARALGVQDVIRAEIRDDAWLAKRAKRVQTYLTDVYGGATLKEIKSRLAREERPRRDEIIAYAMARGQVIHRDGRYFMGGRE